MSWGIFLKAINSIHYDLWLDLFFEFIPQIVFMISTFGYMDFLIFYKWSCNYMENGWEAPGIINQMINLPLAAGSTGG